MGTRDQDARGKCVMEGEHHVDIPIDVEHFLGSILGKRSHGSAGCHQVNVWKNYCKKLIEHLEKYVSANVVTDRFHREAIERSTNKMKEAVDSNSREPLLVAGLFELCLLLLGGVPNHWNRERINRPEYFLLNEFRSLHYSHSHEQKARMVLTHYIRPLLRQSSQDPKVNQLRGRYRRFCERKGPYADFVESFRKEYPNEYLNLFG